MIYLGKTTKNQRIYDEEIIELVFNCLDYSDDFAPIRSFIMRCLDIIPLESEIRTLKNLFSRSPFRLMKVGMATVGHG